MIKSLKHIGLLLLIGIATLLSCDTAEIEISGIEFFIAQEWKIESVIVNGTPATDTDLSKYRLNLKDDFTFTRTTIEDQDEGGNWHLTSGLTQLVLFVDDPREEKYLLLNLEVRQLEMRLLYNSFKEEEGQAPISGELDIRYILVPVKE
ncbi:MAG: hypothetical protein ABFS32_22565 [Bacteroidota bacterium]